MKRCFSGKVKPLLLLLSFVLTFGISVLSLFFYSIMMGKPILSYINLGTTALPPSIFLSLTSGPTGEELGWRGFMREEFNKKHSFLKSSVCQGLVWCFWHTLLWVVDSEFTDWRAIPYVISNIVVITSITVLMNIFLERHNNLLYSVLLHFGFNILYVLDKPLKKCSASTFRIKIFTIFSCQNLRSGYLVRIRAAIIKICICHGFCHWYNRYHFNPAYSCSETASHHSFAVSSPGTSMARWENHESAAAPCQCFTPAWILMTLPGIISTASFPHS